MLNDYTHTPVCGGAVVSHRDNANAIYIFFKKIHTVRGGEETIRQINLSTHMKYLIMCPRYDWVAFVIHEKKVVIKLYLYKTSSLAFFLFVCFPFRQNLSRLY